MAFHRPELRVQLFTSVNSGISSIETQVNRIPTLLAFRFIVQNVFVLCEILLVRTIPEVEAVKIWPVLVGRDFVD